MLLLNTNLKNWKGVPCQQFQNILISYSQRVLQKVLPQCLPLRHLHRLVFVLLPLSSSPTTLDLQIWHQLQVCNFSMRLCFASVKTRGSGISLGSVTLVSVCASPRSKLGNVGMLVIRYSLHPDHRIRLRRTRHRLLPPLFLFESTLGEWETQFGMCYNRRRSECYKRHSDRGGEGNVGLKLVGPAHSVMLSEDY